MNSKPEAIQSSAEALRYPWENHPGPDQVVEVMPGVLWVRLKLPFRLNHVNIYLLADGDGWAMVDSGFGNEESIAAWTALFEGPLAHVKISRLIGPIRIPTMSVSPDGWSSDSIARSICRRSNICSRSITRIAAPTNASWRSGCSFRRHGMDESLTDQLLGRGQDYLKRVSVLPPSYRRISNGDEISIGTRRFKGHYRRRPCARPGHALLRRRQAVFVGRSGAEQDFAQCERLGGRARPELARANIWRRWRASPPRCPMICWCCRAMACRSTD